MSALRVILPIVLGVVAALLNFVVLRGSIAPLELTTLRTEVKADTEITEDMLERLSVRADKEIFKSAVPYSERGLLLGRRVTRPISAGEVLLYADVHNLDEENIRLYLKPGETTLTIPVKSSRIAPGLRRGDSVGVLVSMRPALELSKPVMRTPAATTRNPWPLPSAQPGGACRSLSRSWFRRGASAAGGDQAGAEWPNRPQGGRPSGSHRCRHVPQQRQRRRRDGHRVLSA